MPARMVKLKPEAPPAGPAIVLRRANDGIGFFVATLDKTGAEDIRSISEHNTYAPALKEAEERAHSVRLPLRNESGVEPERKAVQAPATSRRSIEKQADPQRPSEELPSLSSHFKVPSASDRFAEFDTGIIVERSRALFRESRDGYLRLHAEQYGDTRNHACAFTQRTFDQIQGQIASVFDHLLTVQAILYAHLELAYERIERLESQPRTLSYEGVWKEGVEYTRGQFVTHGGALWHTNQSTRAKPGDGDEFTLAVKRGRDGRDAKEATA